MGKVNRTTMFKFKETADLDALAEMCKTFQQDAKKDGKPYILRYCSGPTVEDPRNGGYNWMIQSTFASMDDMKYYDTGCEVHQRLKDSVAGQFEGKPLTLFQEQFAGEA